MDVLERRVLVAVCALALLAGSATALVHDRESDSPLQAQAFIAEVLDVTPINVAPAGAISDSELQSLGADPDVAFLDARGGRWRTLLFAWPLIPGSGVGNDLTWEGFRRPRLGARARSRGPRFRRRTARTRVASLCR
jgi:hypothetical protein